jgi:hypothetical protein
MEARVELEERERISRELHDRVAHSMGVAHQSLQLYEAFQKTQPSKAAEKLALAKEMTKTALESTTNLSMELRQSETEEGIVPALEALVEVAVPPGMSAELRTDGDESKVPPFAARFSPYCGRRCATQSGTRGRITSSSSSASRRRRPPAASRTTAGASKRRPRTAPTVATGRPAGD